MSQEVNYPKFLPTKPSGNDDFGGKPQERIADVISNLIQENTLEKKVIGLEGEWGSGKSNLIEIIKKKIEKTHFTFVYDSWGNQEDLTRRTFLEEIIDSLFDEGYLTDKEKWRNKRDELLAKKSSVTKEILPQVRPHWIFISIGTLLFLILGEFYDYVLAPYDILPWYFGFLKPLVAIYLVPSILIGRGGYLLSKLYKKLQDENKLKSVKDRFSRSEILGRIFYWLKGDSIESKEQEFFIESEPTVKQFREYFELIQEDIKGKGVVIVFDNIDRLEDEKVKALWSSIHTFFAEKSYQKVWVIVPYYKEKLTQIFDKNDSQVSIKNGFIEKTFSINFRVSPPVVGDWETLMKKKLKYSFGTSIIPNDQIRYIVEIFDVVTIEPTIKPRQILNYINQIVSLYKIWKKEVDGGRLEFRYLALYALVKDNIVSDPVNNIINQKHLELCGPLFTDDEDVDRIISALVFNVPIDKADEVLLKRELSQAIRNGRDEDFQFIEKSKSHQAFTKYFKQAYDGADFAFTKDHLCRIIEAVSDLLEPRTISAYWRRFANEIIRLEPEERVLNDNFKTVLLKNPKSIQEKLISVFISSASRNFNSEESQKSYLELLKNLGLLRNSEGFSADINRLIKEKIVNPSVIIPFAKDIRKKPIDWYKVRAKKEDLVSYYYDDDEPNVDRLYESIDSMPYLTDYSWNGIIEDLTDIVSSITIDEKEVLRKIIEILKVVASKPISLSPPKSFYSDIREIEDYDFLTEILAIGISNFKDSYEQPDFKELVESLNNDDCDFLAEEIELFIDYDDLIEIVIENHTLEAITNLRKIVNRITTNGKWSRIYLKWILQKFSLIKTRVFSDDITLVNEFLRKIDRTTYKSEYFNSIDAGFLEYIDLKDFELGISVKDDALKMINNLTSDEVYDALIDEDQVYKILDILVQKGISIKYPDSFYIGYEKFLIWVLDDGDVPSSKFLVYELPLTLDHRKLKGIYTRIRNKIVNDPKIYGVDKIQFFINGILDHGNLTKEANKFVYNLVPYIFDSSQGINEIFVPHVDKLITTILESDYIEDARINIGNKISSIEDEEAKNKIIKRLKLKPKHMLDQD